VPPNQTLALWNAPSSLVVPDNQNNVPTIVGAATQLRIRDQKQIISNIEGGNYEVAATFIWLKAMALLKRQLGKLGNSFIAELLQRPDIEEGDEIQAAISDSEALSLARDLGIISATQAMRLAHSQQVINHFASFTLDDDADEDVGMTEQEAISCLRVCVQSILGQAQVSVAADFSRFREKLETQTLTPQSEDIVKLHESPYFFLRTAISVLLSVVQTRKGAQLEHAARNAAVIIPTFWARLKQPEKWQVGQAYASQFNDGNKDAVKALYAVLTAVKGFDFVPENLRSNTFTSVAHKLLAAHQGINNFYNEPGPTRELANLGTAIPGPALASCMTAVLCVKLGNQWGVSFAAQSDADQILARISIDRWLYYFNERLEYDRIILQKLTWEKPRQNWVTLINKLKIELKDVPSQRVSRLLKATQANRLDRVDSIASEMFRDSM